MVREECMYVYEAGLMARTMRTTRIVCVARMVCMARITRIRD